jgi:hypothetical protein
MKQYAEYTASGSASSDVFQAGEANASLRGRYFGAMTFSTMADRATANRDLWHAVHQRASVPDAFASRVAALGGRWNLLVLSEDWCGDAVNSVPVLARLAEVAPNVDLRILPRDENLDLMDAHLTGTSRSIPAVLVLDADYVERGWWGPRPGALQAWVMGEGLALPKEQRYPKVRQWYARDRGVTTLEEVVTLLERVAAAPPAAVTAPVVG